MPYRSILILGPSSMFIIKIVAYNISSTGSLAIEAWKLPVDDLNGCRVIILIDHLGHILYTPIILSFPYCFLSK
jgi:hypothetical protein